LEINFGETILEKFIAEKYFFLEINNFLYIYIRFFILSIEIFEISFSRISSPPQNFWRGQFINSSTAIAQCSLISLTIINITR